MAVFGSKVKMYITAAMLILFIVLQVVGCSPVSRDTGENAQSNSIKDDLSMENDQSISVWIHPFMGEVKDEEEMWNGFLKSFYVENPGIKVNFQSISWANRDQKMLSAFSAGMGPDAMYLISDHLIQFGSMGIIEPLESYIDEDTMGDYNDMALKSVTVNGHIYGLPILQTIVTYLYNVDLLKKAGVDTNKLPETWEEFDIMCEKVKAVGKLATNYSGGYNSYMTIYPVLWQAGGDVIDENGMVIINSPEAAKALLRIVNMYKKGYISKDSITMINDYSLWENGDIAAYLTDNGMISSYVEGKSKCDFKVAVGPVLKDKVRATYGTVGSWTISKDSTHKEQAVKFIKFLTNKQSMEIFNKNTGYLPPRKSLAGMYGDKPEMKLLIESLQYAKAGVIHPAGRDITTRIIPAVSRTAMLEKRTPEEALNDAAELIYKALQDSIYLKE